MNHFFKEKMEYVQNRTNWCWAVACKILGKQYKRLYPDFTFCIDGQDGGKMRNMIQGKFQKGVITKDLNGLRTEYVRREGNLYFIDAWQRAIVMNANSVKRGVDGNFSGDDIAKLRGLKYVVTGECESRMVEAVSIGTFDSDKSLLYGHCESILPIFEAKHYLIGNAILYPRRVCHSFILLEWLPDDRILIYDPWNGEIYGYSVETVFYQGFFSALGKGVIKWVQYIK